MDYRFPEIAHREAGMPVQNRSWNDAVFSDEDLSGILFENCEFTNLVFKGINFRKSIYTGCRFDHCEFQNCWLGECIFNKCHGSGISISGGELSHVVIADAQWDRLRIEQSGSHCAITEGQVGRIDFNGPGSEQLSLTLSGLSFDSLHAENATWTNVNAINIDLSKCNLDGSHLLRTTLIEAQARELDLSKLVLEACNLYRSDFSGSRLRNASGSIFAESKIEHANFSYAELEGALFAGAKGEKACFDGAKLNNAMFPKADLREASFQNAQAHRSVWNEADLSGARLNGLDAFRGSFRNTCLEKAEVIGASFVSADLQGVERSLEGADIREARHSLDWRAELDKKRSMP